MKPLDITGLRSGMLVAIEATDKRKPTGAVIWRCICDCGNEAEFTGAHIKKKHVKSCGCATSRMKSDSKKTHGHSARSGTSTTYNSWRGMLDRCKPENAYGRRGITVCARWRNFQNFYADMGNCPDGMELDRRNPKGNYTPKNCRWLLKRPNRQYRSTTILTKELRIRIQELSKTMSNKDIALQIGVSDTCISEFLSGKSWDENRF